MKNMDEQFYVLGNKILAIGGREMIHYHTVNVHIFALNIRGSSIFCIIMLMRLLVHSFYLSHNISFNAYNNYIFGRLTVRHCTYCVNIRYYAKMSIITVAVKFLLNSTIN